MGPAAGWAAATAAGEAPGRRTGASHLVRCATSAAAHAGRFQVDDCRPALSVAAGALMGLGRLLQDELDRDNAQAADKVTKDVLRLFGLSAKEAHEICTRPLPDLDKAGTAA